MKKELKKSLLKRWETLTNDNEHNAVRVEIGKWCDDNDLSIDELIINTKYKTGWADLFGDLRDSIEAADGHSNLFGVRLVMTNLMLTEIRKNFGEDVYRKIYRCL